MDIYSDGVLVGSLNCGFQFDGYLYLNGVFSNKSVVFTNEYNKTSYNGNSSYVSLVFNETDITMNCNSTQGTNTNGMFVFASPLDLSKYSKLKVTLSALQYSATSYPTTFRIGIATSPSATANELQLDTQNSGTIVLDLSSITDSGNRYISFFMVNGYGNSNGNAAYATITKLELVE